MRTPRVKTHRYRVKAVAKASGAVLIDSIICSANIAADTGHLNNPFTELTITLLD